MKRGTKKEKLVLPGIQEKKWVNFFNGFCRLEMFFPEAELDLACCGIFAGSLDITSCKS